MSGNTGTPRSNRQIVLKHRPVEQVNQSCFAEAVSEAPTPGPGEALIKNTLVTIDPAIRGWLDEKGSGYLPGVEIGQAVRSAGVGEVIESNLDDYPVGTMVTAMTGWQEHAIVTTDPARPFEYATAVAPGVSPIEAATVFSPTGWTAYVGVHRILDIQPDDKVLVTSGASLVGSLAGQLAAKRGAYVVATAGSEAKCRWCVDDLGFADCINYRTEDLDARLKEAFPSGIDAIFDNVGGATLDAALRRMATGARVTLCGSVATNDTSDRYRLANYDRLMSRRATMSGFNTIDHLDLAPEIFTNFRTWIDDGSLQYRTNIYHGLDKAPQALVELFQGGASDAIGKAVVEI